MERTPPAPGGRFIYFPKLKREMQEKTSPLGSGFFLVKSARACSL